MLPFSCSSSQDVHNKDHHHKEVDDEAKSQDIIPESHWFSQPKLCIFYSPLGRGDDLFNHASVVALGMSSLNQEVGVSIAGGTLCQKTGEKNQF